jgi:hypothetical protein
MTQYIPDHGDLQNHLTQYHGVQNIVEGLDEGFHELLHKSTYSYHTHTKPKKEWWVSQDYMETATIYADTEKEALEEWENIRGTGETEIHRFENPVVEEAL